MGPRVLIVSGSSRADSHVAAVVAVIADALAQTDADVQRCDLAELLPPVFVHGDPTQAQLPAVVELRTQAAWADAFAIVTPEYHGNMSGALKNWFDYLYVELAGKLAGAVAVTGGGGGDMSLTAVERCVAWCHGFSLPFRAAARDACFADGALVDARVRERIQRLAFDVVRYVGPIRAVWQAARAEGPGPRSGVAGLHTEDDNP